MPAPELPAGPHRNRAARLRTGACAAAPWCGSVDPSTDWRRRLPAASHLLQVDQEGLELGRARVRIADERRESVGQPVAAVIRVTVGGDAHITPVDWNPDLEHLLPRDRHR